MVQKPCMLASTPIIEDSDFVRLDEFSFGQFEMSATQKPTKAMEMGKALFEWMFGKQLSSQKACSLLTACQLRLKTKTVGEKLKKISSRGCCKARRRSLSS